MPGLRILLALGALSACVLAQGADPKKLEPAPRPARPALSTARLPIAFITGERIAFIGGSLGERLGRFGNFETLLHARFPRLELVIRNFARPADEVSIRQRPPGYTKLGDPLAAFGADTFFCFFGFNESFAGAAGVAKFKSDYEQFLDEYAKRYPRDDTGAAPRFILVSPAAFEAPDGGFLPSGQRENANLKLYAAAVLSIATKRDLPFLDLFDSSDKLYSETLGLQYTVDGAHQNEAGDLELAQTLDREAFGTTNPLEVTSPAFAKLRAAVADKARVHAQDYRMLNGCYVYGDRNALDRETFPPEYLKIRAMVAVRDRYVWDLAQGKPVAEKPDDSKTGALKVPSTHFGSDPKSEPAELKYPSPEEAIRAMKVPPGFEVQLVASERDPSGLANVGQINFDSRGRLWASCMRAYPMWKPGDPPLGDRLVIFDKLDPKTGRAGKSTVFYDKLVCPTGFEFWNGGVLVVDQPRLLFLKDTDGDDKADVVVELVDGWGSDDTHHAIHAWEYSPGGLLQMLEGAALSTSVETPWGPFRHRATPGCYVLDPRSLKLRHFETPGYENPSSYVFDWWGQGIVGDGSTTQQQWDTPLSGATYPGRTSLKAAFDGDGMRPNCGSEFLYTRQFPDEVQAQFVTACAVNAHGLVRYEITDDGAGFQGGRKTSTVNGRSVSDDLLTSSDATFRPVDPQIGPDGALYFGDWCNAVADDLTYSQRDASRDHTHGRIYRLVYKPKPLLAPVTQFEKSIPELLDQLKEYEPRTRYRVRRELWDRPTAEVVSAIAAWIARQNAKDGGYDHRLLEVLWVEQGHHAVEPGLLKKVLRAPTGEARAAATRVLADEWERIPNAMALLKPQAVDEFARTRVEALRALSFVNTLESVETALLAAGQPRDYWIDYTLNATLGALQPIWQPALAEHRVAQKNPSGLAILQEMEAEAKLASGPEGALQRYLGARDLTPQRRAELYREIAQKPGHAGNGQAVYRRLCASCHRSGQEGADFGPDFDQLGARLKKEEIIESILDPSAKVDPKYATVSVTNQSGLTFTGFLLSETPGSVTMKMIGGLTQVIPRSEIAKLEMPKVSSMPEGLAAGLSAAEFSDLMEYLSSLRKP